MNFLQCIYICSVPTVMVACADKHNDKTLLSACRTSQLARVG